MNKTKGLALICAALLSVSASAQWHLAFKNSSNGDVLQGSKEALIKSIRQGANVRIAWGTTSSRNENQWVEHIADPHFLTVTSGKEVFVQLPEHIAQTSYWNEEFQDFGSPQVLWRGLMSTTGRFMAVWYNRYTGETIRRYPQRVTMSWFVDTPPTEQTITPLYKENKSND